MSDPVIRLAAAEAESALARERLSQSFAALQARLNPRALASSAAQEVIGAGEAAAKAGLESVRQRPGALAGVVAAAGLFLARHRIAALMRRRR